MLWNASKCEGPPDESKDITNFGWKFLDKTSIPVIAEGDPAPPELLDVIQYQCKAQGKLFFYGDMWMPNAAPFMHGIL